MTQYLATQSPTTRPPLSALVTGTVVDSPGEDEVFFGQITDKELRKSTKFSRRKTTLFMPDFRGDRKLLRLTMDHGSKLSCLAEERSSAESAEANNSAAALQQGSNSEVQGYHVATSKPSAAGELPVVSGVQNPGCVVSGHHNHHLPVTAEAEAAVVLACREQRVQTHTPAAAEEINNSCKAACPPLLQQQRGIIIMNEEQSVCTTTQQLLSSSRPTLNVQAATADIAPTHCTNSRPRPRDLQENPASTLLLQVEEEKENWPPPPPQFRSGNGVVKDRLQRGSTERWAQRDRSCVPNVASVNHNTQQLPDSCCCTHADDAASEHTPPVITTTTTQTTLCCEPPLQCVTSSPVLLNCPPPASVCDSSTVSVAAIAAHCAIGKPLGTYEKRGHNKDTAASGLIIRQFDFAAATATSQGNTTADSAISEIKGGDVVEGAIEDTSMDCSSDLLSNSVMFTDEESSIMDNSLKGEICDVLHSLDCTENSGGAKTGDSSSQDSSVTQRISLGGMSDKDDTASEANSSMSSGGPHPEILLDGYTPSGAANMEAPKPVFDMSPLAQALPPLKVTTPAVLHDENLSAFKTYGSSQDVSALVQNEEPAGCTTEHLAVSSQATVDMECTSSASMESSGSGDSGIEDAGSESPSKISRASSTTESPDTVVANMPQDPVSQAETKSESGEKDSTTTVVFKEDISPVVSVNLSVPATSDLDEDNSIPHDKATSDKSPNSKVTRGVPTSPRAKNNKSADRTNTFKVMNDNKPKTPPKQCAKSTKPPVANGNNSSSSNRSRPVTRSNPGVTPSSRSGRSPHPKASPAVVTQRLHSPCPSAQRCCKSHGVSTLAQDGRPLWNSSTLVEPHSLRGTYLRSEDSPAADRLLLPLTPAGRTGTPCTRSCTSSKLALGEVSSAPAQRRGTPSSTSCKPCKSGVRTLSSSERGAHSEQPPPPLPTQQEGQVEVEEALPKLDLDLLDDVKQTERHPKGCESSGGQPSESPVITDKVVRQKRLRSSRACVGEKRACSPSTHSQSGPAKRLPLKPTSSENLPPTGMRDTQLLQLNERQLDAVTNLHTLCNGQQLAKFVTKPLATSVIKATPEPKNPRIQWPHNPAVRCEYELGSPAAQTGSDTRRRPVSASKKPILSLRASDKPFPYSDQPPSPVVVRKTVFRRNANPLSRPLGF